MREAEPYSYCQFIMGRDHSAFGRARHPWLTGTASWFYTAATRHILGIRASYDGLIVDPCIPAHWKGFTVKRRWRGADYRIDVRNPDAATRGLASLSLNGSPVSGPLPVQEPGTENRVVAVLG